MICRVASGARRNGQNKHAGFALTRLPSRSDFFRSETDSLPSALVTWRVALREARSALRCAACRPLAAVVCTSERQDSLRGAVAHERIVLQNRVLL